MSEGSRTASLLHDEHLRTLSMLNDLEQRITGPRKNEPIDVRGDDDRRLVQAILAVIDNDIDRHFRFEEEVLFPTVEQEGMGDVTDLLIQEHNAIRPLAERVRTLTIAAMKQAKPDPSSWKDFRYAAMDLMNSVLFHIQKEEMSLLQQMSFFLDSEIDSELAARHASEQT